MTEEKLNELLFFSENETEFNEATLEDLLNNQSLFILLKVHVTAEIEDIDEEILRIVYSDSKRPPGSPECVYELLSDSIEDESTGEVKQLTGRQSRYLISTHQY